MVRRQKACGFESSFALLGGGASHFAPVPGKPIPSDNVRYREDGALTTVPEGFFSTTFYTDRLLAYIDEHAADEKPFFAYAAYTAPHWPRMAPPEYIDRYRGRYDEGCGRSRGTHRAAKSPRHHPGVVRPEPPAPFHGRQSGLGRSRRGTEAIRGAAHGDLRRDGRTSSTTSVA